MLTVMTLLKKFWRPVVWGAALLIVGLSVRGCVVAKREAREAALRPGTVIVVNDSTQAVIARLRRENGRLAALVDATNTIGGRLVAGVQIRTKVDTLMVPVGAVPTTIVDSTRYATITDTTKTGVRVRIDAEAPPFPAPLRVGYEVVTPEFNPQVGFIRTGRTYAAVVSWAGQQFTVENAFFEPSKQPGTDLHVGVRSGILNGDALDPEVYAGLRQRIAGVTVGVTGSVSRPNDPRLTVSVERALWSR